MSKLEGLSCTSSQLVKREIEPNQNISVSGWVRTRRGSKKFSFISINDGSHPDNIQIIADGSINNYEDITKLTVGASITVVGKLVESPGSGQSFEIQANEIEIHGFADPEKYPLQKKSSTLEHLRENAHLRPRTATFLSVSRIRHALYMAIHNEFTKQGFYWIPTPIVSALDAEGAGENFQVTTLDMDQVPKDGNNKVNYSEDFFGTKTMLCVTGQLEGEAYAMGLNKIYTFGPTFRAENSNTSRHLAEFWMVEPEIAFCDLDQLIEFQTTFYKGVLQNILNTCQPDIKALEEIWKKDIIDEIKKVVEKPFAKCTYTDAIDILQKSNQKFEKKPDWGVDLDSEHENFLVLNHFKAPLFITDYPKDFKAFYMYQNEDEKTVRGVDLIFPLVGELSGGSQREHRLDRLEKRIKELDLDTENLQWYLDLRRFGTTPHAGCGFGFERLLRWVTGMGNIRDVIPFPRVPNECRF